MVILFFTFCFFSFRQVHLGGNTPNPAPTKCKCKTAKPATRTLAFQKQTNRSNREAKRLTKANLWQLPGQLAWLGLPGRCAAGCQTQNKARCCIIE